MTYRSFIDGSDTCFYCDGRGYFPELDVREIIADVTVVRGGRRVFRASPPALDRSTPRGARAYFVWRLARFHGGADVTMPIMAESAIEGDPCGAALDDLAGRVAGRVFGTQMAAAARWGGVLGIPGAERIPTDSLPATARAHGPALLYGDKPDDELAELF